ncbi:MAG: hypothetical protein MJK04_30075 [Psychrosphaera sp.]|nr:hypothetical protein [Psychrosphaera sp.]
MRYKVSVMLFFDLILAVGFVFIVTTIVVRVIAGVNSLTQELAGKPVLLLTAFVGGYGDVGRGNFSCVVSWWQLLVKTFCAVVLGLG